MFSVPNDHRMCGPVDRRRDHREHYYDCQCGVKLTLQESYCCQGDDACEARSGECCKRTCAACGLPACSEHMTDFGGEPTCHICIKEMIAEGQQLSVEAR